jgi:hypothetical protein
MYRVLASVLGDVKEPRRQVQRPVHSKPELLATGPQSGLVMGAYHAQGASEVDALLPLCKHGYLHPPRGWLDCVPLGKESLATRLWKRAFTNKALKPARSKLRGGFPVRNVAILISLVNPAASRGECTRYPGSNRAIDHPCASGCQYEVEGRCSGRPLRINLPDSRIECRNRRLCLRPHGSTGPPAAELEAPCRACLIFVDRFRCLCGLKIQAAHQAHQGAANDGGDDATRSIWC